jgi:hypothetical protein
MTPPHEQTEWSKTRIHPRPVQWVLSDRDSLDTRVWKQQVSVCPVCDNQMSLVNGFHRCPICGYKESCCFSA